MKKVNNLYTLIKISSNLINKLFKLLIILYINYNFFININYFKLNFIKSKDLIYLLILK
jgi:hypothetical protein